MQVFRVNAFFSRSGRTAELTWGETDYTRRIGAVVNGRRTDKNCQTLLHEYRNSRINEFASDEWQSYAKYVSANLHYVGKDKTQRIERTNLEFSASFEASRAKNNCFFKERNDARRGDKFVCSSS